jgi:hypothetical protein
LLNVGRTDVTHAVTAATVHGTLSALTVLTMLPTSTQTDHASANQNGVVMTAASGESSVTQSVLDASPDKSH